MMRKFTVCLVLCVTGLFVSSCNDDVSSPPQSALTVDSQSGLTGDEFTFTVTQTSGDAISLLPYGTANLSLGGILIPASSFSSGKATIKFKYAKVGSFDAVVVTNNHSSDGQSVKNTYSQAVTMTITSPKKQITEFFFDKINVPTDAVIDQDDMTIDVTVPYGTNLTALKASFTSDDFSTVSVGSTAQESGNTPNNFTTPQSFVVKAADGTTETYTVTLHVTDINTDTSFKSFSGKIVSSGNILGTAVATTGSDLVLYDVFDADLTKTGNVAFGYALNNPFAVAHLNDEAKKLAQGTEIKMTTPPLGTDELPTITVAAQDSSTSTHTYNVFIAKVPTVEFSSNPNDEVSVVNVTTRFTVLVKALKTTVTDSKMHLILNVPALAGVTVDGITFKDIAHPAGVSVSDGDDFDIDFSDAVTITLHLTDSNIGGGLSYDVVYNAGLTELK